MQLLQSTLERNFTVKHKGKTYYIDYLNSNGQILLNREIWEVINEDWKEIENKKLKIKLIKFCINQFNDFQPSKEELYETL